MARRPALSKALGQRLKQARVAHLATVGPGRRPHLIPICFAFDGRALYTALDRKPKRHRLDELQRVRNIKANQKVALLVDEYSEKWSRLWYILIRGRARLLRRGADWQKGHHLLKRKYSQYRAGLLPAEAAVIQIFPDRIVSWGRL